MDFPPFAAVIPAAGQSQRFSDRHEKKEFVKIGNCTVLEKSVLPFLNVPGLCAVLVAYQDGLKEQTSEALGTVLKYDVPVILVKGGATRQESVRKCLLQISFLGIQVDYVAIHDGARPFVTEDVIIRTLAFAKTCSAAAPAVRTRDSIKIVDESGAIIGNPTRAQAVAVQTPQIFKWPEILKVHMDAIGENYQDDTHLWKDAGFDVVTCEGDPANFKITYPGDIADA